VKLLDVRIDSYSEKILMAKIRDILRGNAFHQIATVNPEFLVAAQKNKKFKERLNHNQLNICDGFGITFWTKFLYNKKIIRIPGVELAEMICKLAEKEKKSVYLLGGFGVTEAATHYLVSKFPNLKIAGHQDGKKDELHADIISAKPDIILVAFGAPAQEFWIAEHGPNIANLKLGIGIGGTFDFWAGKVKRAPKLFQRLGLEWLWRLMMEPLKRGKRIYTAVIEFSMLVIKEKLAN